MFFLRGHKNFTDIYSIHVFKIDFYGQENYGV